jgi:hypothetical protein
MTEDQGSGGAARSTSAVSELMPTEAQLAKIYEVGADVLDVIARGLDTARRGPEHQRTWCGFAYADDGKTLCILCYWG